MVGLLQLQHTRGVYSTCYTYDAVQGDNSWCNLVPEEASDGEITA